MNKLATDKCPTCLDYLRDCICDQEDARETFYTITLEMVTDRELTEEETQRVINAVMAQIEEPSGEYPNKRADYEVVDARLINLEKE